MSLDGLVVGSGVVVVVVVVVDVVGGAVVVGGGFGLEASTLQENPVTPQGSNSSPTV